MKSQGLNFIKHQVRIKLEGFKPERLISQAAAKGILLRQIHYKDETEVYFTVSKENLRTLKKLAGSKYKFTQLKEGGIVCLLMKIKKSKVVIAGIGVFLLFFFSQTLFVREINVIGCKTITETSIRQMIAEEGLYEGALRRFDCDAVEKKLFQNFDTIVWAKVLYEGGYVEVRISEGKQAPAMETENRKPCDIVCEIDCYIERIYTYKGRSRVQTNDFVRKGDILIAGTVPIEHPSYPVEEGKTMEHYVHADGKIVARVPYYFSFYAEAGTTEKRAETLLRQWIKENVPEHAEILNKDFHFDEKEDKISAICQAAKLCGPECDCGEIRAILAKEQN